MVQSVRQLPDKFRNKTYIPMNQEKINQLASIFDGLDFEVAINTLEWDVLTCEEQMYVEQELA